MTMLILMKICNFNIQLGVAATLSLSMMLLTKARNYCWRVVSCLDYFAFSFTSSTLIFNRDCTHWIVLDVGNIRKLSLSLSSDNQAAIILLPINYFLCLMNSSGNNNSNCFYDYFNLNHKLDQMKFNLTYKVMLTITIRPVRSREGGKQRSRPVSW